MSRTLKFMLLVIVGLFLIAGCSSTPAPTTPMATMEGAPEWVMKGGGAYGGEAGSVFYGVGSASGMKNISLLRTTADNRARNDIAKVFQFYTASLMKDYMASTMAGDPNVTSEEQHVEQAVKTVTSQTLNGVMIVDHWQDPRSGEFFSLARLDLNAFKDAMEKSKELDKRVKEYIKQNAEKMHDQLENEVQKLEDKQQKQQ